MLLFKGFSVWDVSTLCLVSLFKIIQGLSPEGISGLLVFYILDLDGFLCRTMSFHAD